MCRTREETESPRNFAVGDCIVLDVVRLLGDWRSKGRGSPTRRFSSARIAAGPTPLGGHGGNRSASSKGRGHARREEEEDEESARGRGEEEEARGRGRAGEDQGEKGQAV
jgi:hypothetical protein